MNKLVTQAFTLVELLVVIAIIGILSGLIVVGMSSTTQQANIAKGQVFSASIRDSMMANLVSEWKFDVDGTDSWGSNSGTLSGVTVISSGCMYNSCLSFSNAGTQYVTIPDSTSLDNLFGTEKFTFDVWIYSSFKADYQGIINKRTSGYYSASPGGLFIDNDGNTLNFLIGTGNEAESYNGITYSITSMHNTWLNVVATSDGTNMKLYVNGSLVGSGTNTRNPSANNEPMTIGAFYASVRGFYGKIDNVRIYNTAIPTSRINEGYYAGLNRMLAKGELAFNDYQQRVK